jgi:glycosyltransferase involved in cell wall biosynthesis
LKRIAILGIKTYPAFTGPDRVSENIVNHIDEEYTYCLYLMNTDDKLVASANKEFIYLPSFPGKHLKAFSYYFFSMLHVMFSKKYDLIHIHNSDVGLFTYILKWRYPKKMVGTFHGNPYERSKWSTFAKKYLMMSEALFVKSCAYLTSVTSTKTLPGREVIYIPNGIEKIDLDAFKGYVNEAVDYSKLGIKKQNYILFACGRLDRTKGLHHLLNAYERLDTDIQVVVVGNFTHDKEYAADIDARVNGINAAGAKNRVITIKELLPKQDLFDMIINSKFVVFPSEIEAMSMFLLEALACSKLVICSDIEENMIVVGNDYKYTFKSKNADSLYDQLVSVINSGLAANTTRPLVNLSHFDWINIAQQYKALYTQALAVG